MTFILEGPDAVGKSMLAHAILRTYGHSHYIHLRRHRRLVAWQWAALRRARRLMWDGKACVIDRHFWSEQIYGAVYRGKTNNDTAERAQWRIMRQSRRLTLVFALGSSPERATELHTASELVRDEMYHANPNIASTYWALVHGPERYAYVAQSGSLLEETIEAGGLIALMNQGGMRCALGLYDYEARRITMRYRGICEMPFNSEAAFAFEPIAVRPGFQIKSPCKPTTCKTGNI